jgi:hypothetical protein
MQMLSARRAVTKMTDARARATRRWQTRFLKALCQSPSVKAACSAAGISRMTAYRYRDADAEFAENWQYALQQSVDDLEAVAFKLASEGDSNLIQFLLRAHRPEIYKDTQRRELTGADGRPLTGKIIFLPAKELGDE